MAAAHTKVHLTQRAIRRIQEEIRSFNTPPVPQPVAAPTEKSDRAKLLLAKKFGKKPTKIAKVADKDAVDTVDTVADEVADLALDEAGPSTKLEEKAKPVPKPIAQPRAEEIKTVFLDVIDDSDISHLLGMVIGTSDTPYEGAMFLFDISLPGNYPIEVPKFKFITPDEPTCRMHPNLYEAPGKVCLSILNTWASNQWCATSSLENILVTIQGILIDNPIICEPGHENSGLGSTASIHYCITARHRAMTSGFVRFMKRRDLPVNFMEGCKKFIRANIPMYEHTMKALNDDLVKVGLASADGTKTALKEVHIQHLHSHNFVLTRKRVRDLIAGIRETIQSVMD